MAAKLITDFVKIAQSGPCIDGRRIEAAWLTDMAETYDPTVYTAKIWPDHIRWGSNYGTVTALEAREESGVTSLHARLAPNAQYVWSNQFDQLLHFSIEVAENFAGSGKAYLAGLGITDSPASLGTDELKFSPRRSEQGVHFFSNVPAVNLRSEAEDSTPGWFKKFVTTFTPNTHNPIEDKSMNPAQFADFNKRLDGFEATLTEIRGLFAADTGKGAEGPTVAPEQQTQAGTDFAAAVAPLLEGITTLSGQVSDMAKRFEAAQPKTHTSAGTGPVGDAPLL